MSELLLAAAALLVHIGVVTAVVHAYCIERP